MGLLDELGLSPVINAAGRLTALGGSSLRQRVIDAMAEAGRSHIDLAELRRAAGAEIARLVGAPAATVTAGASASLVMAVAGCITGTDAALVARLPDSTGLRNRVPIQVGHLVNFGAPVEQMIRLGGGVPLPIGSVNSVSERALAYALESGDVACTLFVVSHHATQTNQLPLAVCIELCHAVGTPIVVDAAAEEDLRRYLDAGADLVAYSGGKAFEGPTSGILLGRADLIAAAEAQFGGVARPMKVGKEDILGLVAAVQHYVAGDLAAEKQRQDALLEQICRAVSALPELDIRIVPDDAGREINRIGLFTTPTRARAIARDLAAGNPSIRTRNHYVSEGIVLIDPRALTTADGILIAERLQQVCVADGPPPPNPGGV
ncbi:MAG: PLP-dependent aminotransferase family protein [Dehalococcoidia bacterium]